MIITSWRITVAAWKNFARNIWLALTTVFVLVLALLSVNVLVGVNVLLTNAVAILENKIDVSVYFKQGTPDAVLEQAKFFMTSLPQVKSAKLLSAEEALTVFREKHANDPKILAALIELEQNPLGASLVLKAKRTADYQFLLEALQNPQFGFAIESKNFEDHAKTINQVRDIGKSVKFFGFGLILVFALFSILIVYNTIRVAIYTQREEIGIMRLVGASSAYVRLPFVLEGVILALFALALTGAVVITVAYYLDPSLSSVFGGADPGLVNYFKNQALQLALIQGGGLSLLVGISSWAAAGKYLKR